MLLVLGGDDELIAIGRIGDSCIVERHIIDVSDRHFLAIDDDKALLGIDQDDALSLVAPRRVEQDNVIGFTIEIDKFVYSLLIGMFGIANVGGLLQVIRCSWLEEQADGIADEHREERSNERHLGVVGYRHGKNEDYRRYQNGEYFLVVHVFLKV